VSEESRFLWIEQLVTCALPRLVARMTEFEQETRGSAGSMPEYVDRVKERLDEMRSGLTNWPFGNGGGQGSVAGAANKATSICRHVENIFINAH
jgi:hypothetical protein